MHIRFHKGLYPKKAVDEAVEAFQEAATMKVSRQGEHWALSIEPGDPDVSEDELIGEFQNYVLGLAIAKRGNA